MTTWFWKFRYNFYVTSVHEYPLLSFRVLVIYGGSQLTFSSKKNSGKSHAKQICLLRFNILNMLNILLG